MSQQGRFYCRIWMQAVRELCRYLSGAPSHVQEGRHPASNLPQVTSQFLLHPLLNQGRKCEVTCWKILQLVYPSCQIFVEQNQELMEKTPVWQDRGILQKCIYFKKPARSPSKAGCFNKSQREKDLIWPTKSECCWFIMSVKTEMAYRCHVRENSTAAKNNQ